MCWLRVAGLGATRRLGTAATITSQVDCLPAASARLITGFAMQWMAAISMLAGATSPFVGRRRRQQAASSGQHLFIRVIGRATRWVDTKAANAFAAGHAAPDSFWRVVVSRCSPADDSNEPTASHHAPVTVTRYTFPHVRVAAGTPLVRRCTPNQAGVHGGAPSGHAPAAREAASATRSGTARTPLSVRA